MNTFRALLWFDAAATLLGAFLCVAAPRAFAAGYFAPPVDATSVAFVRWLGVMFFVYGAVVARGLRVGDRAFWRAVLPVMLAGDTLHLALSISRAVDPHFHWTASSASDLFLVVSFLPVRVWLALHPERLDRAPR